MITIQQWVHSRVHESLDDYEDQSVQGMLQSKPDPCPGWMGAYLNSRLEMSGTFIQAKIAIPYCFNMTSFRITPLS